VKEFSNAHLHARQSFKLISAFSNCLPWAPCGCTCTTPTESVPPTVLSVDFKVGAGAAVDGFELIATS
jgi:hypothetical protein